MSPLIQKDKDLLLAADARQEVPAKRPIPVSWNYSSKLDFYRAMLAYRIDEESWANVDNAEFIALWEDEIKMEEANITPVVNTTRWRNLADIDTWQRTLGYCKSKYMPHACAIFQKYIDEEMKYPVKPDWDEGAVNTVTADVKAFKENATLLHKQTNGHIPVPSGAPLTYEDIKAKYDTLCPPISSSTQGTTMSIKIEQKTFVTAPGLGAIESKMLTVESAVSVIKQAEDEIERLEKLKNKPKSVTKKIEDLQAGIDALVKELDSREETK